MTSSPSPPPAPFRYCLPVINGIADDDDDDDVYIDMPPAYSPTPTPAPTPSLSPSIPNAAPPNPGAPPPTSPTSPPRNPHHISSSSWSDDAIPDFEGNNHSGFVDRTVCLREEEEEEGDDDDDAAFVHHYQQQQEQTHTLRAARSENDDAATMTTRRFDQPRPLPGARHYQARPFLPHHHHHPTSEMRRWWCGSENCCGCCCRDDDDDGDDATTIIEEVAHLVFTVGMMVDVLTVVTYILARYRAVGSVMEEAVVRVEFETRMADVLMVVVGGVLWAAVRGDAATPREVVGGRTARYVAVAVVVYVGAVRGVDGLVDWVGGRV